MMQNDFICIGVHLRHPVGLHVKHYQYPTVDSTLCLIFFDLRVH
jgi:hypothetical protein